MTDSPETNVGPSLGELESWHPKDVRMWLSRVWPEGAPPPPGPDWFGLATMGISLAQEATRGDDGVRAADWAAVAVSILDRLGDSQGERELHLLSSMQLRVHLISSLGPKAGDPVRDPTIVVRWFKRFGSTSAWLASAIHIMRGLASSQDVVLDADIARWLDSQ